MGYGQRPRIRFSNGRAMPTYMVERILPGATMETVEAIQEAARRASETFQVEGRPVRYVHSIFTPGETRCRCLFEAPTAQLVQELNDAAQIPYSRIVIAIDLTVK
jgi:Protein of unknown function (DUF4242)